MANKQAHATRKPERASQLFAAQGAGEKRKGNVHIGTLTASRSQQRSDANKSAAGVSSLTAEQGSAVRRPFAVFDIDGTLIRWQLYHAVVDRLAKKDLLGSNTKEKLRESRMKWKRREHHDSFKQYERNLIEFYESALSGLDVADFDKAVDEVVLEYREQVYTYTRDLIAKLKKNDYLLMAISGSHHELVAHIAKLYKFDDWVGTRYERKGNRFTGKKFIASADKQTILNQLVKKHRLGFEDSIAVGDSASDASMLKIVERPIVFNPDKQLFEIASSLTWDIVIERKNMIYKLKSINGSYQLAKSSAFDP